MILKPKRINLFMLFKLPLAYISGMRVQLITDTSAIVRIRHKWINQNPFNSMFWAAQGMAAEMSTGVLVMQEIKKSNRTVSMLVTRQESEFFKKATGKILFTCCGGNKIKEAIQKSIQTGEGQIVRLTSKGENEDGVIVASFLFEWSLKVKK
ncbi:MAG: DUF4442 domain-containing protein [Polaribacter sp.]|jgi:hypothetical protein|nr:DUF4442 domain-containing protein [Polaribacter sp.]MDG2357601.1 DUF4442 domain-containing protein [Polaribacter sp.]